MKKKMMYEAPSTDVVGVRMNAKILSGSFDVSRQNYSAASTDDYDTVWGD